jgi:mannosyltransferase
LATYIIIPLSALLVIAYGRPKFAPRYLLVVTPALALLVGQGMAVLGRRRWRAVGFVLAAMVFAASGLAL